MYILLYAKFKFVNFDDSLLINKYIYGAVKTVFVENSYLKFTEV